MQNSIQDILTNFALGVLTLLCAYAMYYIKRAIAKVKLEAQKIDNEEQRSLILTALSRLDDVATKTVRSIEQTTAKEIREAVKAGLTSRDQLFQLSRQAFDQIYDQLEPEYLAVLASTLGDMDNYIKNTIESKVLELKGAV
ncbi:guanylate kinase [Paenibacillus sp. M1]|uniref:Guanylate kinase n=1 Tax=Paenibacillus haidiansis TaxID=1574488 RepID=A0ABU7W0Z1_9BACL